jgi:hypothetical protein
MSLRDWSALRAFGLALGWIVLVLVVALPRALHFFSGRATNGPGGIAGVSFGPKALLLVLFRKRAYWYALEIAPS